MIELPTLEPSFLEKVRLALVTALEPLNADNDGRFDITPYVKASPNAPGFEIDIDTEGVNYDLAMGRGLDEWWLVVRGFASGAIDEDAQSVVDHWLDPLGASSVKTLLEEDRTLGGVAQSLIVTNARPRVFNIGSGAIYYGAQWRVKIWA